MPSAGFSFGRGLCRAFRFSLCLAGIFVRFGNLGLEVFYHGAQRVGQLADFILQTQIQPGVEVAVGHRAGVGLQLAQRPDGDFFQSQ